MGFLHRNIDCYALIIALKEEQEPALRQLFDLYADQVYSVAQRVLKDSFESEEVVQEVFIRLWNTRMQLDEEGNIWSYLYVIAKRLSLNRLRNLHSKINHSIASLDVEVQGTRSDCSTHVREIKEIEHAVLEKLPEQQRKVYLLSREEGLTHKEIAAHLNIAPNTVKNHIIQALKAFKKHFKSLGYILILTFLK